MHFFRCCIACCLALKRPQPFFPPNFSAASSSPTRLWKSDQSDRACYSVKHCSSDRLRLRVGPMKCVDFISLELAWIIVIQRKTVRKIGVPSSIVVVSVAGARRGGSFGFAPGAWGLACIDLPPRPFCFGLWLVTSLLVLQIANECKCEAGRRVCALPSDTCFGDWCLP